MKRARPRTRASRALLATLATPFLLLSGCGTTHLARPLDKHAFRFSGSIGGPLLEGASTPTALTAVGVAYGVLDGFAVHADLMPTALGAGVVAGDVGFAWNPVPGKGQEWLTLGSMVLGSVNPDDHLALVDGWASSGSYIGEHVFLAGGVHGVLPLSTSAEKARRSALPMFFALLGYRPGDARVTFELEARWYAPFECGDCTFVPLLSPGGAGALGFLLGASYDTKRKKEVRDEEARAAAK